MKNNKRNLHKSNKRKKSVKMNISFAGYKRFKSIMSKMKFRNEDLFLKYCVLKTVMPVLSKSQKKQATEEIKLLLEYKKHP